MITIHFDGKTIVIAHEIEFFAVMFGVGVNGPEGGKFVVPACVVEVE